MSEATPGWLNLVALFEANPTDDRSRLEDLGTRTGLFRVAEEKEEKEMLGEEDMEKVRAEIRRLEQRLAEAGVLYPEEPMEGSILRFTYRFSKGGVKYTYAALRVGDLWYTTGPRSAGTGYTWRQLVDWLRKGVVKRLKMLPSTDFDAYGLEVRLG